jgi:hypothetical protein
MYNNHKNFIINDIFTANEINQIYEFIKTVDSTYALDLLGQKIYNAGLPSNILDKVTKRMNDVLDYSVYLTEHSFVSYTNETGYVPKLFPHFDEVFPKPRITLDVQLGGNFEWPLFVKGKEFVLNNNEALVFSGTNQIHWRKDQKILDGQQLDMIFFHFSSDQYVEFDPEYREYVEAECDLWQNELNMSREAEKINE